MFHCQTTPPITYTKVSSCSDPSARVPSCRDLDPVGFLLQRFVRGSSWWNGGFLYCWNGPSFGEMVFFDVYLLVKWSEIGPSIPIGGRWHGGGVLFDSYQIHTRRIDGKLYIYRHRWLILSMVNSTVNIAYLDHHGSWVIFVWQDVPCFLASLLA